MECSVCALLNFFFGYIHQLWSYAIYNPFILFLISLFIATVILINIQAANSICNPPTSNNRANIDSAAAAYDYGDLRGPHAWLRSNSTHQSPINIVEESVQKLPIRELLTWNHYDDMPCSVMLENNGHTVIVRANYTGNTPTISGADLLASYTFIELCCRWSVFNGEGTEHMLNYKKFPLELQVLHRTGPATEITSSYDILMVAYFFEISTTNPYLEPLTQNLHRIRKPNSKLEIPPFPLSYLCHQFRNCFYSYGGSLTQPPCCQGVEWFIFPEPLAISERQLNEFHHLLSTDGKTRILHNTRPVQNISNNRVVSLNQYQPRSHEPIEEQRGSIFENQQDCPPEGI